MIKKQKSMDINQVTVLILDPIKLERALIISAKRLSRKVLKILIAATHTICVMPSHAAYGMFYLYFKNDSSWSEKLQILVCVKKRLNVKSSHGLKYSSRRLLPKYVLPTIGDMLWPLNVKNQRNFAYNLELSFLRTLKYCRQWIKLNFTLMRTWSTVSIVFQTWSLVLKFIFLENEKTFNLAELPFCRLAKLSVSQNFVKILSRAACISVNVPCRDVELGEQCELQCEIDFVLCSNDCSNSSCLTECARILSTCSASCPCSEGCPDGCDGCSNPICVCNANPTPQNEENYKNCLREKSDDLGQCILDCQSTGSQTCKNNCVSDFERQHESCPCQVGTWS